MWDTNTYLLIITHQHVRGRGGGERQEGVGVNKGPACQDAFFT